MLSASLKAGSVLGKCWPISPNPARKQRVRQRVRQHVPVRMAMQTKRVFDPYSADDERPALNQRMAVEPKPNAHAGH